MKNLGLGLITMGLMQLPATAAHATSATTTSPAAVAPAVSADVYITTLNKVISTGPYEAYNKQMVGLLENSQYAALDQYYSTLQKAYEDGKVDDKTLAYSFIPLSVLDDRKYAPAFEGWAKAFPQSYVASYALAAYEINLAWAARGGKWASKTSQEQFAMFAQLLQVATKENERSLLLSPKPMMSLRNKLKMLRAGSSLGLSDAERAKQAQETLAKANALDPFNFSARYNYMVTLQPRWGGSYDAMKAFAEQTRAEKVPAKIADYMDSMVLYEIGEAMYRSKNYAEAQPLLLQAAAKEAPYYDYGHVDALQKYIDATYYRSWAENKSDPNTKEFLDALDLLLRDGRYIESPGWYYGERAQIKWNLNHDAAGTWADYNKGAAFGDPHSLYNVASIYCKGQEELKIEPDKKLCTSLMAQAALKGSKLAEKDLTALQPVPAATSGNWMKR